MKQTFHESLKAWKFAVVGERQGTWPTELVATSQAEYDTWLNHLASAKIAANQHGIACQFNRSGKGRNMSAWVIANEHAFKITYKQLTRPQAVTATSREAYRTVNLGERCEEVARAALKLRVCTDNQVGREIGMPANLVSGRRNDISKNGITVDGVHYVLKITQLVAKDEVTGRKGNLWFLEPIFNQPTETGAQIKLEL